MPRQIRRLAAVLLFLFLAALFVLALSSPGLRDFAPFRHLKPGPQSVGLVTTTEPVAAQPSTSAAAHATPSQSAPQSPAVTSHATTLPTDDIAAYIKEILEPASIKPSRLQCPALNSTRYDALSKPQGQDKGSISFFFALDLRNCVNNLPRLLGSITDAIRFLGPGRCALSIVEGNSKDGTDDVLRGLKDHLQEIGVSYFLSSSGIDPSKGDRIRKLAELRNLALQPLYEGLDGASPDTTVLFINDVVPCVEDLLELALQRQALGADMTCAMDWTYVGPDPTFYDVWVARTIHGDSFFEIPPDGNWNSAWNLFWNAPDTSSRFHSHRPFQVFSCWNGATAIGAGPFLQGLRFRNSRDGECAQGEPQLLAKDLWYRGFGKIAVVPSVNLEYSDEAATKIKALKGFTSSLVTGHGLEHDAIDWRVEPPEKVKCMSSWGNQFWEPWNKTNV